MITRSPRRTTHRAILGDALFDIVENLAECRLDLIAGETLNHNSKQCVKVFDR